jgi:NgoFVII restriction endonuclease
MRYLDTGSRDATQAVGAWLQNELTPDVIEVRWQSGFFAADGLGVFAPTLRRLASDDRTVKALIGSNDGETPRDHVLQLMKLLGVPRSRAELGVVSYSGGAYFHPKVYHLRRTDGSQGAYVGSANLTASGIASLHIEAGVVLDTRDDDPTEVLDQVATAIDK